jgi:hypothetical protein
MAQKGAVLAMMMIMMMETTRISFGGTEFLDSVDSVTV